VYIENQNGACGALRMMTIFYLFNLVLPILGNLTMLRRPFRLVLVSVVWFRNTLIFVGSRDSAVLALVGDRGLSSLGTEVVL